MNVAMTPAEILNLPCKCCGDEITIREYLRKLLVLLIREVDLFSGKRPFGNSGWIYELYEPLIRAGVVDGFIDGDGEVCRVDLDAADNLLLDAIMHMCSESETVTCKDCGGPAPPYSGGKDGASLCNACTMERIAQMVGSGPVDDVHELRIALEAGQRVSQEKE